MGQYNKETNWVGGNCDAIKVANKRCAKNIETYLE
jgi:hypothetical protein